MRTGVGISFILYKCIKDGEKDSDNLFVHFEFPTIKFILEAVETNKLVTSFVRLNSHNYILEQHNVGTSATLFCNDAYKERYINI